jgi:multidrug efflux pump subunit AcrA (membrane-fusion protein)
LPASVRFVAYKQRTTPTADGKLVRVSADAMTEERTGNTYFLGTVEVDGDQLSRMHQVKLYPGMPVEAAIVTGRRTMLAFLFQPFTDSFAHAFHEE